MSESKRAFSADSDVKTRTHIGGQALIEGIMMRGRYNWAVAVRQPDGTIYTEEHDLASGRKKNAWMYWPIIRGCTAFVESLALGYKALSISSDHAYDWDEEEEDAQVVLAAVEDVPGRDRPISARDSKPPQRQQGQPEADDEGADVLGPARFVSVLDSGDVRSEESGLESSSRDEHDSEHDSSQSAPPAEALSADKDDSESSGMGVLMTVSVILGVVLGVAIFMVLPAWVSNLVLGEDQMNSAAWNIFDGVLRVAIFIVYIWLISLMKDIKRMFSYHGAEHKTIHCYEHGQQLTPENAKKYPRLHVRCGTAFMIMTMIIAILVYTILGQPINALVDLTGVTQGPLRFILIVLTRIILMPIIAGLSYEVTVKWAGSHPENLLVRIVLWPGMQMQRLTTNEPDEGMLECAIVAMNIVLEREELEAKRQQESAADASESTVG